MLIHFGVLLICGWALFAIGDYYLRRFLAFQAPEHVPKYTPGATGTASPLPRVLVCVLGWGGCTRRQLRRLLEFYEAQGIPTVSWINPLFSYFCGMDTKLMERVLDLLLHENRNGEQIFIHLHSNNGTLAWGHLLQTMKANEQYKRLLPNIKGIILDSGPFVRSGGASDWILPSAIGSSRACVSVILNRAQYFHLLWSPLTIYYLSLRLLYQRYLSSNPLSISEQIQQLFNATPAEIRQCYLYGDADRLIPPRYIGNVLLI